MDGKNQDAKLLRPSQKSVPGGLDEVLGVKLLPLFSIDKKVISHVDRKQASKMIKCGAAKLILQNPPCIEMLVPTKGNSYEKYYSRRFSSHGYKEGLNPVIYGNYRVLHVDGREMFCTGVKRILWYLERDLLNIVSSDPPVLQFKHNTNGTGWTGDKYYLAEKSSNCVVCNSCKNLSMHHIVPHSIRRFMPNDIKSYKSHDLVIMCLDCHKRCEIKIEQLKNELSKKYDIPVHPVRDKNKRLQHQIVNYASAYIRYYEKIPDARKEFLLNRINDYLGRVASQDDIETLAGTDRLQLQRVSDDDLFGKQLVDKTEDLQALCETFRSHFIDSMQPKYMPTGWSIKRSIFKS